MIAFASCFAEASSENSPASTRSPFESRIVMRHGTVSATGAGVSGVDRRLGRVDRRLRLGLRLLWRLHGCRRVRGRRRGGSGLRERHRLGRDGLRMLVRRRLDGRAHGEGIRRRRRLGRKGGREERRLGGRLGSRRDGLAGIAHPARTGLGLDRKLGLDRRRRLRKVLVSGWTGGSGSEAVTGSVSGACRGSGAVRLSALARLLEGHLEGGGAGATGSGLWATGSRTSSASGACPFACGRSPERPRQRAAARKPARARARPRNGLERPRVDVGGDVGELAGRRDDEACVLAPERLADVANEDVVGRVDDGDDRELSVEGVRERPEEARLLLREEARRGRVDDCSRRVTNSRPFWPASSRARSTSEMRPRSVRISPRRLPVLTPSSSALDRLGRQEARPEDQRAERRVGTFAERSAHRLSIRPRDAAPVARGLKRFHVISRSGGGIGPV